MFIAFRFSSPPTATGGGTPPSLMCESNNHKCYRRYCINKLLKFLSVRFGYPFWATRGIELQGESITWDNKRLAQAMSFLQTLLAIEAAGCPWAEPRPTRSCAYHHGATDCVRVVCAADFLGADKVLAVLNTRAKSIFDQCHTCAPVMQSKATSALQVGVQEEAGAGTTKRQTSHRRTLVPVEEYDEEDGQIAEIGELGCINSYPTKTDKTMLALHRNV